MLTLCVALAALTVWGAAPAGAATFTNPIADSYDPTIVTDGGEYYLIGTEEGRTLTIKKATTLAGLKTAPETTVWTGPASGLGCCRLWSPVLQRVQGRWWIYLSVTDDQNPVRRSALYALEGNATDPLGPYTLKGAVKDWQTGDPDYWEKGIIGPGVIEMPDGRLFLTTTTFGFYVNELSNPYTIRPGTRTVTIDAGAPDFPWEGQTSEIARPFLHTVGGRTKVFVPYTSETHTGNRTNGAPCWSWCIGLWTNTDGNIANPASWTKSSQPAFAGGPTSGIYRILALATFKSPDQSEDWIVFNANDTPGTTFGERDTFVQRFTWNGDGTPNFGTPQPIGTQLTVPSGETGSPTPIRPNTSLLSDDFPGSTAPNWTPLSGTWSVRGAAYHATAAGGNLSVAGETRWADYVTQALMIPNNGTNNSGAGIVARVRGSGDYYSLELYTDAAGVRKWRIAANRNGTVTTRISGNFAWNPGSRAWLRLDVNAGTLTALISTDGWRYSQLGSVRDAPGVALVSRWHDYGRVGLRTWGGETASFTNVRVTSNRTTYGFYTGIGWPGIVLDAGSSTEANKEFCVAAFNEYCVGGLQLSTTAAINTAGVPGALPEAVYKTERWNDAAPGTRMNDGSFWYVVPSLIPGRGYRVILHFAEIHFTRPGQRTFDVSINNSLVLNEFDKVAAAGGAFRAVTREIDAVADLTGHLRIQFSPGTAPGVGDHNPTVSAVEVRPLARRINAGGAATGDFGADSTFTSSDVLTTASPINRAGVSYPAPEAAYQSERYRFGSPGDFKSQLNGLAPNARYRLRLHFAEIHYTRPGQRMFDVAVNGTTVLEDFDKVAEAGGPNRAITREFFVVASPTGVIDVHFKQGGVPFVDGNPTVSAIELLTN